MARRSHAGGVLRDSLFFFGALALAGQWIVLRGVAGSHLDPGWETTLSGLAILGSAVLLSWGAELAQLDISQALALAFLALVAVLPEYAVDVYLAWRAAKDPAYIGFASANMTGANRLLIGIGWSAVLLAYWATTGRRVIHVKPAQRLELLTLLVATGYAFAIPFKRSLSLVDTAFFFALFVLYLQQASRGDVEPPGLEGLPARLGGLPRRWRRGLTILLFVVPAYAIFLSAEPFADGLLHSARRLGVEEFLLIQWLAPLASETPEFVVAVLFATRHNPTAGLGTLISSKVNQWTLLVGMLPLVYAISGRRLEPMVLDARQAEEIFLTAAQSLLALVLLASLRFGIVAATLLLGLFVLQFVFPDPAIRIVLAVAYLVVVAGLVTRRPVRQSLLDLVRFGWRPPAAG